MALLTFQRAENAIKQYCIDNRLDFNKIRHMSKAYNQTYLSLQYFDPEKGRNGLLDEAPASVVLRVEKTSGGVLKIESTEYTKTYLS